MSSIISANFYLCGGNDHLNPKTLAQVYCNSCLSLIHFPKRCKVVGKDLLKSLIETKQVLPLSNDHRESWFEEIDNFLEDERPLIETFSIDDDHKCNKAASSNAVESYSCC